MPFKPETLELDPQGQVLERLFWTANVASDAVWRSSMEEFLDSRSSFATWRSRTSSPRKTA